LTFLSPNLFNVVHPSDPADSSPVSQSPRSERTPLLADADADRGDCEAGDESAGSEGWTTLKRLGESEVEVDEVH